MIFNQWWNNVKNLCKKEKQENDESNNKIVTRAFKYFKEYCDVTGIQGLRYVTEERTLIEKLWWISCIVLSMIYCGFMVYGIFNKYFTYPITVTFTMQETPIREIPFPSVTICPSAKISLSYFNITEMILKENNGTISCEEQKKLNMAATICEFSNRKIIYSCNDNTTEEEYYNFLLNSNFTFFEKCIYRQNNKICSTIFTPIMTEDGICYVFNILDKTDIFDDTVKFPLPDFQSTKPGSTWNVEDGYTDKASYAYPTKPIRQGAKNSLYVVLKTRKSDVESFCSNGDSGYRMSLNLPSAIPDIRDNHISVPLDQMVRGIIYPNVFKTSTGVQKFDMSKRDCYFLSERKLEYFKIYNQENCLFECKTNFQIKYCNCTEMYMPGTANSTLCIYNKPGCKDIVDYYIARTAYESNECDCRSTCTDISYNLEISQNRLMWNPEDTNIDHDYHYSVVNLYFKKSHAETKERLEVYSFTDLISNFGGLLGLFTGFTILSFAEIVYFLSLRAWGNLKLYGNWCAVEKHN